MEKGLEYPLISDDLPAHPIEHFHKFDSLVANKHPEAQENFFKHMMKLYLQKKMIGPFRAKDYAKDGYIVSPLDPSKKLFFTVIRMLDKSRGRKFQRPIADGTLPGKRASGADCTVNDLIPASFTNVALPNITSNVEAILQCDCGPLFGEDLADAFHSIKVADSRLHLQAVAIGETFGLLAMCQQGNAASMAAATRLARAVADGEFTHLMGKQLANWDVRSVADPKKMVSTPKDVEVSIYCKDMAVNCDKLGNVRSSVNVYVDDFNGCTYAPDHMVDIVVLDPNETLKKTLKQRGMLTNDDKSLRPQEAHVWQGARYCTRSQAISREAEKYEKVLEKIKRLVTSCKENGFAKLGAYDSLAGSFGHLCEIYKLGRYGLRSIYQFILRFLPNDGSHYPKNKRIFLKFNRNRVKQVIADLAWVLHLVKEVSPPIPFHCFKFFPKVVRDTVVVDASGKKNLGFGGYFRNMYWAIKWSDLPEPIQDILGDSWNSSVLENYATHLSAIMILKFIKNADDFTYVNVVTDNFSNRTATNKFKPISGCSHLGHLAIAEMLAKQKRLVITTWVKRSTIQAADHLSKFNFDKFAEKTVNGKSLLYIAGKWRYRITEKFRNVEDLMKKIIKNRNRIGDFLDDVWANKLALDISKLESAYRYFLAKFLHHPPMFLPYADNSTCPLKFATSRK